MPKSTQSTNEAIIALRRKGIGFCEIAEKLKINYKELLTRIGAEELGAELEALDVLERIDIKNEAIRASRIARQEQSKILSTSNNQSVKAKICRDLQDYSKGIISIMDEAPFFSKKGEQLELDLGDYG